MKHVAPGDIEVQQSCAPNNGNSGNVLENVYERPFKKHRTRKIINHSDDTITKIESILHYDDINSCTSWILSEIEKGIRNGENIYVTIVDCINCYSMAELRIFLNDCDIQNQFVTKTEAVKLFCDAFKIQN